ncbi:phage tail protein [Cronobacter sakazakii]
MSQTAITYAFEQWKAQQAANGVDVVLDEFVFANVPGLDVSAPVNRAETLPDAAMIVHRQAVTKTGLVNDKGVVYSVVLSATTGDFEFNWIGLINRATGTLAMVVHAPAQKKIQTAAGQQGNVLTRSFLMEYNGAAKETAINTPADTWQIDFTARLDGVDERVRIENVDAYGAAAFFGDGFLVTRTGAQYRVTAGVGYVAGLRTALAQNLDIVITTKPVYVWVDAAWRGALTSIWSVESKITVAPSLADYVQNGITHHVFAVARIEADGSITDLRPKGSLNDQQAESRYLQKSKNLSDLTDPAAARDALALKEAALKDVGKVAGTVAAGDDSRIVKALQKDNNLSDLTDPAAARDALALKEAALKDVGIVAGTVAAGDDPRIVNAFPVSATPLNVDLNTLGGREHRGVYFQEGDVHAKAELHYPIALSGTLIVTPTAYGCVQEYTTYAASRKFIRGLLSTWTGSGPWSAWAEIYSENHKPAPQEIGAVPAAGGSVGYLEGATYYKTKEGVNPAGTGAYANQLDSGAPFYVPDFFWTPTAGGAYVPLVKGRSTRAGQGWPTAVSYGYLLEEGSGKYAKGCIHVGGDAIHATWFFDPATKAIQSDGGMIAGSAVYQNNGDIAGGSVWGKVTLSSWLISAFSLRDQNINTRAPTDTVNQHVANLNNYIATKADTATVNQHVANLNSSIATKSEYDWVRQNFVGDVALGAEGAFIIAKNAWQRVPAGCVLTGYNAEGDEPVNDTLFYRPVQKFNHSIGAWITVGHTA